MASPATSSISVASQSQTNKQLEAQTLVDKDSLIGDFEGSRDFLQTFSRLREDHRDGHGTHGVWESNMPYYCLPAVNVFPEIIHLCAEHYDAEHRAINTSSGRILFQINAETINKMLHFDQTELLIPFSMNQLMEIGRASCRERVYHPV